MRRRILSLLFLSLASLVLASCGVAFSTSEAETGLPISGLKPSSPALEKDSPSPEPVQKEMVPETKKAEVFAQLDATVTAGILFDDKGHMFVSRNGGLDMITPEGQVSAFCSYEELSTLKDYYFKSPLAWDMVWDEEGNILAAAQDRILKISPSGEIATLLADTFDGFLGASGLERDGEGYLYITSGSRIMKYSPDMEGKLWLEAGSLGYDSFFSLRLDPDGKQLYVTDFNSSSLIRIPILADGSAGAPELVVSEPIKRAKPYGAPLNMVFSESGSLYASLDCRWSLLKLDAMGKTSLVDMPRAGENHYIAFGRHGFDEQSVYFTTFDGKKIFRFPLGEKGHD